MSASLACVRPPSDCERPGSTEAVPHHLTKLWPPSGGPYLQPWTTWRYKLLKTNFLILILESI